MPRPSLNSGKNPVLSWPWTSVERRGRVRWSPVLGNEVWMEAGRTTATAVVELALKTMGSPVHGYFPEIGNLEVPCIFSCGPFVWDLLRV